MSNPWNRLATSTNGAVTLFRDIPYKGALSYNRTPLYEYILSLKLNYWVKAGLSYQYQGGVNIQTRPLPAYDVDATATSSGTSMGVFNSDLSLNGLLLKLYVLSPYTWVVGNMSMQPYLSAGVGPGWQSWTHIQTNYSKSTTSYNSERLPIRQKISANAIWMIDAGFDLKRSVFNSGFSVKLGCKYNQWGQARNIGVLANQGSGKIGFDQAFRIKTVYQFAPYLGFNWEFPNMSTCKGSGQLGGRNTNIWRPYFMTNKLLRSPNAVWTEFNAAIGFLYFSGLSGNLMGTSGNYFTAGTNSFRDAPMKGRLSYNRTPLFEYLLGYTGKLGFRYAFSYQYQNGVTVQTKFLQAFNPSTQGGSTIQFTSYLKLNACLLKIYWDSPFSIFCKNLAYTPYVAAGIGPGWQSWTRPEGNFLSFANGTVGIINETLYFKNKSSANAVWMVDFGLKIQGPVPKQNFVATLGCKYNQWGQARSIGKLTQQGSQKQGFVDPLKIKTVYQFAPYLGVQWNFEPTFDSPPPCTICGKNPNTWVPFWVPSKNIGCLSNTWTQFNAGVGFLYFSGVSANLSGQPGVNFAPATAVRDVPLKGTLSYNKTPLFEYLLGHRYNEIFQMALSYQHQAGVTVSTKSLHTFADASSAGFSKLVMNLELDAVLLKLYFDIPYSMVFKNLATSPYVAIGVGPGWQSWTSVDAVYQNQTAGSAFSSNILTLRSKVSANAVWMVDTGFRIQGANPNCKFSATVGCKYNEWGQARSVGKMSEQNERKLALFKPFKVKTVYQFAPYLGVQWSF